MLKANVLKVIVKAFKAEGINNFNPTEDEIDSFSNFNDKNFRSGLSVLRDRMGLEEGDYLDFELEQSLVN